MCMSGPSVGAPAPVAPLPQMPQFQPARPTGGLIPSSQDKRGQQAAAAGPAPFTGPNLSDSTAFTPTGMPRTPGMTQLLRARQEPQQARVAEAGEARKRKNQFRNAGSFLG